MAFGVLRYVCLVAVIGDSFSQLYLGSNCRLDSACSPQPRNIARDVIPEVTNTCGLEGPERVCYQVGSTGGLAGTCDTCDASDPKTYHGPELMTDEEETLKPTEFSYWQSQNYVAIYRNSPGHVNITMSFNKTFELSYVNILFKYIRPESMIILKSTDFGRTFTPYQYFSGRCTQVYGISHSRVRHRQDVICIDAYSDIIPLANGNVEFSTLNNRLFVDRNENFFELTELHDWVTITDIRLQLDRPNTFGDEIFEDSKVLDSYYYAISDINVEAICKCNGHAKACNKTMTGELVCQCEHNTEGRDCERCKPFYQDKPWSRGDDIEAHVCVECNCHNHTNSCHFNSSVYIASGDKSGGVCDGCQDNTIGQYCERCLPNYYRNPEVPNTHPDTCIECNCNPNGTIDGLLGCLAETELGRSEEVGQCPCKPNVELRDCSQCKDEYYNLDYNNEDGCTACDCVPIGTVNQSRICDKMSGQCMCRENVEGRNCGMCKPGFYLLSEIHEEGCIPCQCSPGGSISLICDPENGDCMCRPNISSRSLINNCDKPDPGSLCPTIDHIRFEAELNGGTFYSDAGKFGLEYTGLGFAKLGDGEAVNIIVDVPYTSFYHVIFRYGIGENTTIFAIDYTLSKLNCSQVPSLTDCIDSPTSDNCLPLEGSEEETLYGVPHNNASSISSGNLHCLAAGLKYMITFSAEVPAGCLLLDSIILAPDVTGVKAFDINSSSIEDYIDAKCLETRTALGTLSEENTEVCEPLTCSITFEINNGSLPCDCDVDGSVSNNCVDYGGACPCKEKRVGRRCDMCEPGRFKPDCEVCDCNILGSLSAVCDYDGQCFCKPGVTGMKCDKCLPDYFGFDTGEGCKPCECHSLGAADSQCDSVTGICTCQPGVTGDICDQCILGHYNLTGTGCSVCNCDTNGTLDLICNSTTGQCFCKENVEGDSCSQCIQGYFGLDDKNEEGCLPCECRDLADSCSLIEDLRRRVFSIEASDDNAFKIVDELMRPLSDSMLDVYSNGTIRIDINLLSSTSENFGVFIGLPPSWVDALKSAFSYARLAFTIQIPESIIQIPFEARDLLMNVGRLSLHRSFPNNVTVGIDPVRISVDLIGQGWYDKETELDISDLQRLLSEVAFIAIRVGFSFSHSIIVRDVELEFYQLSNDASLPLVQDEELCHCPDAYDGLTCELCSTGYERADNGSCVQCDCNGYSDSCIATTGVCYGCTNNTIGDHCEVCLPKHYRDPFDDQCKPCPCPGTKGESQFANECNVTLDGHITCLDCRVGHDGDRCEVCSPGYYGDPTGVFGDASPCVDCECNGNVDPSTNPICEHLNGTCINCTSNTYGRECERCRPGYYGDAVSVKNCTECSNCDVFGVSEDVCDHMDGTCICDKHVIGEFCDRCEDGYYNLTQGCLPCECNSVGTIDPSEPCNHVDGACECKPGVGGQTCDRCMPGFFNFTTEGCQPCECVATGSDDKTCDGRGRCSCLDNVIGDKCDICKDGYHNIEDGCIPCHLCYGLVDREYQEALVLYRHLITIVNKLQEGDSSFTTGVLLDPKTLREISMYHIILSRHLEFAKQILSREIATHELLNLIQDGATMVTDRVNAFQLIVSSAAMSAVESEAFVTKSTHILNQLKVTDRVLRVLLTETKNLISESEGIFAMTKETFSSLENLADLVNSTSHEQHASITITLLKAREGLDNSIKAFEMLCEAVSLQNRTEDLLKQVNLNDLKELLDNCRDALLNARKEVPQSLKNALDILNIMEAYDFKNFNIDLLSGQLETWSNKEKEVTISSDELDNNEERLFEQTTKLLNNASDLLGESVRLDELAVELKRRISNARHLANVSFSVGQDAIDDLESLLQDAKTKLQDIITFQKKLRDLLMKMRDIKTEAELTLKDAEESDELIGDIEEVMKSSLALIRKAAMNSKIALEKSLEAHNLAVKTLEDTVVLSQRSMKQLEVTQRAMQRLTVVTARVSNDGETVRQLNVSTVEVKESSIFVSEQLEEIVDMVTNLSVQFNEIDFVLPQQIVSLNDTINALSDYLGKTHETISLIAANQRNLEERTEKLEEKYLILKHHRDLLKKIRDNTKDLDCENVQDDT